MSPDWAHQYSSVTSAFPSARLPKHLHRFFTVSVPPFLLVGGDNLQSQILKKRGGGDQKKMNVWWVLSPCHGYLPLWGGVDYVSCQKRLYKMKYGFEGYIFKCQSWPVLEKNIFCDFLVLLNHLNNKTRN